MTVYTTTPLHFSLGNSQKRSDNEAEGMTGFVDYLRVAAPNLVQYESILVALADEPSDLLTAYESKDAFCAAIKELRASPRLKPAHQINLWKKLAEWNEANKKHVRLSLSPSSTAAIETSTWFTDTDYAQYDSPLPGFRLDGGTTDLASHGSRLWTPKTEPSIAPSPVFGIEKSIWSPGTNISEPLVPLPDLELEMQSPALQTSSMKEKKRSPSYLRRLARRREERNAFSELQDISPIANERQDFENPNEHPAIIAKLVETLDTPEFIPKQHGWPQTFREHDGWTNDSCGVFATLDKEKTGWCRSYLEMGSCPHGDHCWYAHKIEDVADCKLERQFGQCHHRDNTVRKCLYKHHA
jgi:hypothetical protein